MRKTLKTQKQKAGFNVYLDNAEREYLATRSEESGYSKSSYIRLILRQDMEVSNEDNSI